LATKSNSWIEAAFDAHADRINPDLVAVEGKHEAGRCWCCGREKTTLQKCHIIPKSLGGSAEPDNIIPLCIDCHDKAPDVRDKEAMWTWIADQQNGLSGVGLGHLNYLLDALPVLCASYDPNPTECELVLEWMDFLVRERASLHGGQRGQGAFLKRSTIEWVIEQSFQRATGNLKKLTKSH